jgi:hypothetical protein
MDSRRLSAIFSQLRHAGFLIATVDEPQPGQAGEADDPEVMHILQTAPVFLVHPGRPRTCQTARTKTDAPSSAQLHRCRRHVRAFRGHDGLH